MSKWSKDGGPVFPLTWSIDQWQHGTLQQGMSLRDHFAGLAMQGLIVDTDEPNSEWIARHAYEMADAMLAERNRKENQ